MLGSLSKYLSPKLNLFDVFFFLDTLRLDFELTMLFRGILLTFEVYFEEFSTTMAGRGLSPYRHYSSSIIGRAGYWRYFFKKFWKSSEYLTFLSKSLYPLIDSLAYNLDYKAL